MVIIRIQMIRAHIQYGKHGKLVLYIHTISFPKFTIRVSDVGVIIVSFI